MYIIPFPPRGDPSCPRSTPVEKSHDTCIFPTLFLLIWLSLLYRWLYMSPACIAQLRELPICFSRSALAAAMQGTTSAVAAPMHAIRLWILRMSSSSGPKIADLERKVPTRRGLGVADAGANRVPITRLQFHEVKRCFTGRQAAITSMHRSVALFAA